MKKYCQQIIIISGFLLVTGCSREFIKHASISHGNYDSIKEHISALIPTEMKQNKIVGLSIALVDNQDMVWAQGFGYADKLKKIPATPETVYRIGSISKIFTCIAALQLAEQGKMDIDKPLKTYIPEFSIKSRYGDISLITPRNIMTHHSGLPRDYLKGEWSYNPESFYRLLDYLKDEYMAYPPDYIFSYSNIGITLLGIAIERLSGESFSDYMDKHLFYPMSMKNSKFSHYISSSPLMSKAYINGKESPDVPLRDIPMGGMNSNVIDMSKFISALFAGGKAGEIQIIKSETIFEMLRSQNTEIVFDNKLKVGFGWFLSSAEGNVIAIENAGTVAHHEGGTIRFVSELIILPDYKLGVVILANSPSGMNSIKKIAVRTLSMALKVKTGIKQPPVQTLPTAFGTPNRELAEKYIGYYAMPFGFGLFNVIANKKHSLFINIAGLNLHTIIHPDGSLEPKYYLLGILPINSETLSSIRISQINLNSREFLSIRSGNQELGIGEKIKPMTIPEIWKKRLGKYKWINKENGDFTIIKSLELGCENDIMFIRYSVWNQPKFKIRIPLQPISDNDAIILYKIAGMGETVHVSNLNSDVFLHYSGYIFRRNRN